MSRRRILFRSFLAVLAMVHFVALPAQVVGCGTSHESADCCCAEPATEAPTSSCCASSQAPAVPVPNRCQCEVQDAPTLPAIPGEARPVAAPKLALVAAGPLAVPYLTERFSTPAAPVAAPRTGPPLRLLFCVSRT